MKYSRQAIVHSGALLKLFQDYKDRVDFLVVYLLEAHPSDGWSLGAHYSFLSKHKTLEDRLEAARTMMELDNHKTFTTDIKDDSRVRMVIDNMNDDFSLLYESVPDRAFIFKDGKIAFVGRTISQQVQPSEVNTLMTDELRRWLGRHFKTSRSCSIV
ncbi:type I iodothyronine deiodinase-like [Ptychodera flava]|uniref:type I iodothyronine deiodinase-like n=1 Tax=Ptychodera flava TaxID=63121 RepID=UPI00396A304A